MWHNDAMTVVGDAAHAPSPSTAQGASMALEDAAVLAKCLRDMPATPAALALFEKLRRDRVERIVRAGVGVGNPAPPSPRSGPRPGNPMEWLFGYHIDWHATVTAPSSSGSRSSLSTGSTAPAGGISIIEASHQIYGPLVPAS